MRNNNYPINNVLRFTNNGIEVEGCKAIAEALKTNETLTTLVIYETSTTSISQTLRFTNNEIEVEGCKAIAKTLKENSSSTENNHGMT